MIINNILMNDTDLVKLEIIKDYISLHNQNIQEEFELVNVSTQDWLNDYQKLIAGDFGEVRETGFTNELELEIEIPGKDADSGNPVIFNFIKPAE